jgi:hypothetical protein
MNHLTRLTALTATPLAAAAIVAGTACAAPAPPAPPAASAAPTPAPIDPGAEYLKAFDNVALAYGNDSNIGRTVGTVAGLVVGCGLGAVTGGTLTLFVSAGALTPLGALGGCLIGAAGLGFWASTIGGVITGGPALLGALQQQYGALHAKGLIAEPMTSRGAAS